MRRLTAAVMLSVDGVMQAPGGPEEDPTAQFELGGWVFPFWDDSGDEQFGKFLFEPDYDLLLGRRTYDIFAAYWPNNRDNPIGERFERINKYVLTHSNEPLAWANSHRRSGDTAKVIRELKESEGRDLLIQGSSTLYPPLISARLIDRLLLIRYPVVLGRGKRIFDGSENPGTLRLVDHFVSSKGVVFTTYEPAGEVRTGTFATKEPSQAELELRERIREGTW
ncbi:MAG: dihydrofolate reductase family protein [Sphingomicrobium sp.]